MKNLSLSEKIALVEKMSRVTKYCVACGFRTDTEFLVCADCAEIHGCAVTYVPATCGDDVCYVSENGDLNFDGNCEHEAAFDLVINPEFL